MITDLFTRDMFVCIGDWLGVLGALGTGRSVSRALRTWFGEGILECVYR